MLTNKAEQKWKKLSVFLYSEMAPVLYSLLHAWEQEFITFEVQGNSMRK